MADRESRGPGARLAVATGLVVIFGFFGVFGGWASVAPLSTAAIAPGEVMVESRRKTVQHLEGGIVKEILVADGDLVEAGEVLVRLDDVQPRASLAVLEGRRLAARTLKARLIAERDGLETIRFPPDLAARRDEPEVAELMAGQREIFQARQESLASQIAVLRKRDEQVAEEIRGLEAQIAADDERLRLLEEEVAAVETLVNQGLMPRPRLLELRRRGARIRGDRGRSVAAIARARQSIAETQLKIADLRTKGANEVVKELREVEARLFDVAERINAARDVLRRTDIVAPITGYVVGMLIATPGGVISPGEPLMDIVPSGDALVVEARVRPADIDVVHAGLEAEVRFTAFSQRDIAPVKGRVVSLSADRLIDKDSKQAYYLARIVMEGDMREALAGSSLHPGMQAEVMIVTGERSALSYFMRPVLSSFNRAFRED